MCAVKNPNSIDENSAKAEPSPQITYIIRSGTYCLEQNRRWLSAPLLLQAGGTAGLGWMGWDQVPSLCLGISFSLGNFTLSPRSRREEAGAQPIPLCSGPRPDGGDRGVQILQALQQLPGKMWGAGKRGRWSQIGQGVLRE